MKLGPSLFRAYSRAVVTTQSPDNTGVAWLACILQVKAVFENWYWHTLAIDGAIPGAS